MEVEKPINAIILRLAQACAHAKGCNLRRVSRLAHGDPPALDNLLSGNGSITVRKAQTTIDWLLDAGNWPEGARIPKVKAPWPNGIRK